MNRTNKKKKTHKALRIMLVILLLIAGFTTYSLYTSKYGLVTTYYSIDAPALSESVRIVQLTDQHGTVFGEDNQRLISAVQEASPDLIMITGDVINYKSGDPNQEIKHATDLIQKLTGIAPVYISYGNHEDAFDKLYQEQGNVETGENISPAYAESISEDAGTINDEYSIGNTFDSYDADSIDTVLDSVDVDYDNIAAARHGSGSIGKLYEQAGATVLDYEYQDIEIKGQKLRIGGIYGYCQIDQYAEETRRENESAYLKAFQDTSDYKILMCHMPVCWLGLSLYDWDVDCVFAGHAHGGQIQIPFVGGLWAPDQGWFPGKEYGIYETNEEKWDTYQEQRINWIKKQMNKGEDISLEVLERYPFEKRYMVLSRGLGSTEKVPRFNNVPEIVVVDLKS